MTTYRSRRNSKALPIDKERAIVRAYVNREKVEFIASKFKVHRTTVQEAVRRRGIPMRPPGRPPSKRGEQPTTLTRA